MFPGCLPVAADISYYTMVVKMLSLRFIPDYCYLEIPFRSKC